MTLLTDELASLQRTLQRKDLDSHQRKVIKEGIARVEAEMRFWEREAVRVDNNMGHDDQ